jgi:hypothetical protein
MRIRQVVVMSVAAIASTLGGMSPATACKVCDPFFHCIAQPLGALTCVEGPGACAMLLQCFGGGRRLPDGDESLTTWSLFDAPVGAASPGRGAALRSEAGDITLGDDARAFTTFDAPVGSLADAALAFGDAFAISIVDASGDGFGLARAEEGGRVRLDVREVTHDVPGRLLASEVLGPRDQLRVPVTVEGRERVLLLQAADVHGGLVPFEVARLRRGLAAAGRTLPRRSEPLLRAHAQ